MTKVWNMRDQNCPAHAVRVDRKTKWGNPHKISKTMNRHIVIDAFRCDLISGKLGVTVEDVKRELRGKDLACWCAPASCHADVLAEIANQ